MTIDHITSDAIDVMKQGGQQIADDAFWKWHNGKYRCEQQRPEQEKHWKAVKDRVAELSRQLKEMVR